VNDHTANKQRAIGVDVGGTKIAAGLVEATGEVRDRLVLPTPAAEGPSAVLDAIAELAERLRTREVVGVGVGTGGVVDHARGVIVSATSLLPGWAGTPVAAELSARLGLPVAMDNDGNALALGEYRFGAARGLGSVLCIAVGTGVGGGVIIGGRLVRGAHHTAGEVGHIPVPGSEGMPCSCGRTGHLEAIASGPAMTARYVAEAATRAQAHQHGDSGDPHLGGGPCAAIDLRVITERARTGDVVAAKVIADGAGALGRAIGGLANSIDPDAVIVGGGVAEIGEPYWAPLRAAVRENTLPALAALEIRPAGLRTDAGIVGAAALAFAQGET
jgi:glucokinase